MSSPSSSVAVTVPIVVWFSAALNVGSEVMTGATSLTFVILIVISCVLKLTLSLAVTIAE